MRINFIWNQKKQKGDLGIVSISINQSLIQNRVDELHTYTSQLWARPLNERSNGPDININYNFGITFTASKAALASA